MTEQTAATSVRRQLLTRTLMQFLAETDQPIPAGQALAAVRSRATYTPYEDETYVSGGRRGDIMLRWTSTWMKAVGWLTKAGGAWTLTDEGRAALAEHPHDLDRVLSQRYSDVREASVQRAWLVRGSSVRGTNMVPTWLSEGYVSLPAGRLPTLPEGWDDDALRTAVESGYDTLGYSQRQLKYEEIRSFLRRIRIGDSVITTSEGNVYVGTITSDAVQQDSPGGRSNLRREIDWLNVDAPVDYADLPAKLAGQLRAAADVVDLSDAADQIAALVVAPVPDDGGTHTTGSESTDGGDQAPVVVQSFPGFALLPDITAARLLVGRDWLDEFVELLAERRQVILYGPPGTGKTYLAQEVAEALTSTERVRLVQFHPAYAYEDFFEGYRPAPGAGGQVGFRLVPGPFRKMVDAAREDPGNAYILIIDEINRANLAKVFGELYFLLEYRDRTIEPLYSSNEPERPFSLPENVFLIGTMNTADRSIALVDAAMRRRFAFLSLHPDDEHLAGVLPAWLAAKGYGSEPADLLAELNSRIPDRDYKIGPSYLMRESVSKPGGLERIWRSSILPLLTEFHIGEDVDVAGRYGLPALRAAVARRATAAEPAEPAAPPTGGP